MNVFECQYNLLLFPHITLVNSPIFRLIIDYTAV